MLFLLTGHAGCCNSSDTLHTDFLVKNTAKTALSASHSMSEKTCDFGSAADLLSKFPK